MSPQQHFGIMEFAKLVVVDGDKPHLAQTFTLHTIMYNIAQAIKLSTSGQFFLSLLNGSSHPKAETTTIVNLNFKQFFTLHASFFQSRNPTSFVQP